MTCILWKWRTIVTNPANSYCVWRLPPRTSYFWYAVCVAHAIICPIKRPSQALIALSQCQCTFGLCGDSAALDQHLLGHLFELRRIAGRGPGTLDRRSYFVKLKIQAPKTSHRWLGWPWQEFGDAWSDGRTIVVGHWLGGAGQFFLLYLSGNYIGRL